eukprot:comp24506_c0_seq1/m.46757 comp24506_c0_seq1/g.46757  ORF comp24506_c0_seq1/g.46757 comp24506_c0_seq1/m.46757 type:complete len:289 (-) comp24506_c0_seq1:610-1476(-)
MKMCRSNFGSELALAQNSWTDVSFAKKESLEFSSSKLATLSGAVLTVDRLPPTAVDSDSSSVDSLPETKMDAVTEASRLRAFVEATARRLQAKMDDLDQTGVVVYNAVHKDLEQLRAENAKLKEENDLLKLEVSALQHSNVSMFKTFQKEEENLEFVRQTTTDALEETKSQLSSLQLERDQLFSECSRLQQEAATAAEDLKHAQVETDKWRQRCIEFEHELAAREEDKNHLRPAVVKERRKSLGSQVAHTPAVLTRKLSKTFTQAMPKVLRNRLSHPLSDSKKSITTE